jgi:DNA-binding MarR family transcriptional regulator
MKPATHLPELLRETIQGLVRTEEPDLTARQLAVLLVCYLDKGPHTVRGLAMRLNVAKPAITRALDRLELFGLAKRREDPTDRRSIVVVRTITGSAFIGELRASMKAAFVELSRSSAAPQTAAA